MDVFKLTFALYVLAICGHTFKEIVLTKNASPPYLEIGCHACFVAMLYRYSAILDPVPPSGNNESACKNANSGVGGDCGASTFSVSALLARFPFLIIIGMAAAFISGMYCGKRSAWFNGGSAASSETRSSSSASLTSASVLSTSKASGSGGSALGGGGGGRGVDNSNAMGGTNANDKRQPKIRLKVHNSTNIVKKEQTASSKERMSNEHKSPGPGDRNLGNASQDATERERRSSGDFDTNKSEYAPSVMSGGTTAHGKSEYDEAELKEIFDAAKKAVIKIGNNSFTSDDTEVDSDIKWALMQSSNSLNIWSAFSQKNGILLRGVAVFNCDAYSLSKAMIDNNIIIGIESIFQTIEPIHKADDITLQRLFCKARAYYSSHRDFTVVTGVSDHNSDGGCILATKSFAKDDKYNATRKRKGHIRGWIHGSGFIVRPKFSSSHHHHSTQTELIIGIHMTMNGSTSSSSKQWNLTKSELIVAELSNYVQKLKGLVEKSESKSDIGLERRVLAPILSDVELESDLSSNQKDRLLGVVKESINRIKGLHDIILSNRGGDENGKTSTNNSNNVRFWETIYDSNGIVVREQAPDSTQPLGVLNASCSIDAPLVVVQVVNYYYLYYHNSLLQVQVILHIVNCKL